MAAKYQLITELYRRTGMAVAKNPQAWQGFLSSACHNYKCRFDEQLLIYLLTSGKLNRHLYQTEQTALQRLELLTKQLAAEQGVTEELKEKAPMQWLGITDILIPKKKTIMRTIWKACLPRSMKSTPRGNWQGSVLLRKKGSCPLRTSGIRSPRGSLILSVTWTTMKNPCLKA